MEKHMLRVWHAGLRNIPAGPIPFKELPFMSATESEKQADYSDRRLLLVEDNELNLEIAKELVSATNARIDTAVNGQEALDMIAMCLSPSTCGSCIVSWRNIWRNFRDILGDGHAKAGSFHMGRKGVFLHKHPEFLKKRVDNFIVRCYYGSTLK